MQTTLRYREKLITFKRWTRRKEAVLISLKSVIRIGVLSFSLSLVIIPYNGFSQEIDSLNTITNLELEEVEVTAEGIPEVYSQIARTITVIQSAEISSLPANTLQDLLEYVAGVDVRQRNTHGVQADIQLRGGSFDQVLVLLNGINITDPQTGHFNLNIPVELSSVEKIEILHGSGARLYGANAYKGVINIITKQEWTGVNAGIEIGEYNLNHSYVGAGLDLKKHHHNFQLSRNSSDGYTDNTDYELKNLFYSGGADLSNVNIHWQGGLNEKAFGANDFYSPLFPEQYEETGTGFASMGFSTKGNFKLQGSGWYRQHKDHFLLVRDDPDFYENYHKTHVGGFKLQTWFSSRYGYTYLGMESRYEGIKSTVLGEAVDNPDKVKGREDVYYDFGFSRMNTGFFAEQKYQLHNLFLSGGLLLNVNQEYDSPVQLFPGLDLAYFIPGTDMKLFGSLSRSLRLPTFTDMFYSDPANSGDPGLQPEELVSMEAGTEYSAGKISSRLSLFNDLGKNVIDWVKYDGSTIYQADNIAEVKSRGVEVDFAWKSMEPIAGIGLRQFRLNYAWIDQELSSGGLESKYAGDFLKHKLAGNVRLEAFKNIYIDYSVVFQVRNGSYSDYDELSGTGFISDFEPYWLSDLRLSYSRPSVYLFMKVSNLFNVDYNDVGNLVQPGRWISGGFGIKFEKKNKSS